MRTRLGFAAFAVIAALSAGPAASEEPDCAAGASACTLPQSCLARVGAGALSAAPGQDAPRQDAQSAALDCEAALTAYRDCLSTIVGRCGAPARAPSNDDREAEARAAYQAAVAAEDPAVMALVAERFPNTFWGALAARDGAAKAVEAAEGDPLAEGDGSVGSADDLTGDADGAPIRLDAGAAAAICPDGPALSLVSVWRSASGGALPTVVVTIEGGDDVRRTLRAGDVLRLSDRCGARLDRTGRDQRFFALFSRISLAEAP